MLHELRGISFVVNFRSTSLYSTHYARVSFMFAVVGDRLGALQGDGGSILGRRDQPTITQVSPDHTVELESYGVSLSATYRTDGRTFCVLSVVYLVTRRRVVSKQTTLLPIDLTVLPGGSNTWFKSPSTPHPPLPTHTERKKLMITITYPHSALLGRSAFTLISPEGPAHFAT